MILSEIPIIRVQFEQNNESNLLTYILPILVALIAAFIALCQVKSNNISSARIAWMENLREILSELIVAYADCHLIVMNMHHKLEEARKISQIAIGEIIKTDYHLHVASIHKVNKLANKVLLYLDSDNANHHRIEALIDKLSKNLRFEDVLNLKQDELQENLDEIILLSKKIFKCEWQKSKRIWKI
ncbi:hypothetical protein [Flavobacterium sp. 5]|uniref:hypothetical protein n=1 Tax=Flavobacterium sp. 5 TaxID=2035199 RepID=UPI000C2CA2A7|nr:hypothetical protein [Flavobacterium sp. 5]PKB17955.1 hypothetical protein CLU82_3207 [Flavobacterium sp. 5]